jgi:tRNA 2-thiouridine synthesizing protein A
VGDVSNQNRMLDCTGLRCPLPILRFRKAAQALHPGQQIWLLSDDPNTHRDFPDFCRAAGHNLLEIQDMVTGWRFLVQAGCTATRGGE